MGGFEFESGRGFDDLARLLEGVEEHILEAADEAIQEAASDAAGPGARRCAGRHGRFTRQHREWTGRIGRGVCPNGRAKCATCAAGRSENRDCSIARSTRSKRDLRERIVKKVKGVL